MSEKAIQPKIASREVTTHILKAFGLRMSKKLGQNFLIDASIVQGIVDAAEIEEGDRVLEIGPGTFFGQFDVKCCFTLCISFCGVFFTVYF